MCKGNRRFIFKNVENNNNKSYKNPKIQSSLSILSHFQRLFKARQSFRHKMYVFLYCCDTGFFLIGLSDKKWNYRNDWNFGILCLFCMS